MMNQQMAGQTQINVASEELKLKDNRYVLETVFEKREIPVTMEQLMKRKEMLEKQKANIDGYIAKIDNMIDMIKANPIKP